jgi:DNA-binding response OmpR family regulator
MSATTWIPAETRILVVDDDSMMRFNIAAYLEDSGYNVARDGLDVMRELHDGYPELPVIAVSGRCIISLTV